MPGWLTRRTPDFRLGGGDVADPAPLHEVPQDTLAGQHPLEARPEFHAPWRMRSHHGTISLAPLDRAQVRDMVAELSGRHALAKDVVEEPVSPKRRGELCLLCRRQRAANCRRTHDQ
jgi:hypothetical protein